MSRMNTHGIKEDFPKESYLWVTGSKELKIGDHAYDHLEADDPLRNIYDEDRLIKIAKRKPVRAYTQHNGRIRAYFRENKKYVQVILAEEDQHITVVTFTTPKELPKNES